MQYHTTEIIMIMFCVCVSVRTRARIRVCICVWMSDIEDVVVVVGCLAVSAGVYLLASSQRHKKHSLNGRGRVGRRGRGGEARRTFPKTYFSFSTKTKIFALLFDIHMLKCGFDLFFLPPVDHIYRRVVGWLRTDFG